MWLYEKYEFKQLGFGLIHEDVQFRLSKELSMLDPDNVRKCDLLFCSFIVDMFLVNGTW